MFYIFSYMKLLNNQIFFFIKDEHLLYIVKNSFNLRNLKFFYIFLKILYTI